MPGENSEIKIKQGEMGEDRIKIQTSPIDFMLRKVTLDVADISMMEYSKRFESRHNLDIYIDNIIDSYNKRDAEQFSIIQEKIKGPNLYDLNMENKELVQTSSNGYSDNTDNSVTTENQGLENGNILGLLETSILWLEVINSNFNDLLGLVSANNYLAGISVLNTNTLEDINLILGGEALGIKFVNEDKTVLGALREVTPDLGFASGMESLVTGLDAIITNTDCIVTGLETIIANTSDMVDNTSVNIFQIIVETLGVLVALLALPAELGITATVAVVGAVIYGIARLVDTYLLSSNEGSEYHTKADYGEPSELENHVFLTNYSTMSNQSEPDFATLFGGSEEFTKQFTEAFETSFRINFETSYNTIYNSYLEELEKLDTLDMLYAPNKTTGKQNTYTQMLPPYTTGESTRSSNLSTKKDLYDNIYNEKNYGEQKIEHTYNMPITNNIAVNVENKTDYDEIAKQVINTISNGLYSAAAVRGMIKPN